MSYDINFKVKVENIDYYVTIGGGANITWNVRKIITESTGLPWNNCANNGLCKDVMPAIARGFNELLNYGYKYKKYESSNGWGTVAGTLRFFKELLEEWEDFIRFNEELVDVVTFWIE